MIIVKIGSNLIPGKSLLDSLLGKSFENDLITQTSILSQQLNNIGIQLPIVHYEEDKQNVNSLQFVFGLKKHIFDCVTIKVQDIISIIRNILLSYKPKALLSDGEVSNFVQSGNKALFKGNYNEAMDNYDKAYFGALLADKTPQLLDNVIITLFNVGYINYINNHLGDAYDCVQILQNIVDDPEFHDPIMRYHAHMFQANLLWLSDDDNDKRASIQLFYQCVKDVERVSEVKLSMFAYWNIVLACFAIGEATSELCKLTLRNMLSLTRNTQFSAEHRNRIHELYENVLEAENQQLERVNQQLQQDFRHVAAQLEAQNSFRDRVVFVGKVGSQLLLHFCAAYGITKPNNVNNIIGNYNTVTNSITASLISRR